MTERFKAWRQIALLVAVVLPMVLGALLLGADFAVMYYNWAMLQKAADGAALAGAAYLPGSSSMARSTATNLAGMHGVSAAIGDTVNVTVDGSASPTWLQVTLSRTTPYYFGRVIGPKSAVVKAISKATTVVPCHSVGSNHLIPIGIDCTIKDCYRLGQVITLTSARGGPGDWAALSLPGMTRASNMETATDTGWTSSNPSDGTQILTVNSGAGCRSDKAGCVTMRRGRGVNKTLAGVKDRINASTSLALGDTAQDPNPMDPRVVEVPMVDFTGVDGKSSLVPVIGFAEVWLVGGNSKGDLQIVFIQAVSPGNVRGGSCPDFGSYLPVL
ncbi:MAG TPA: hypothetical protein VMD75_01715 [Candidatus Binataceae bacterium]|nr:hypothetical protein [Candidatus Binataceae bacterium]